ncbi:hypothetical protein LM010_11735 [Lacticaseibacillus manihotivorans]|jgi:competence protein ComGF|uniref:Prepilin-type N-terminal cleavage/methylation domain-containing protein n=2 Tax=Lacticaseibacillus manihotivorans TaxID=88233 RepID=A0A5P8JSI7_9LACO|nr:hypothetical protein LM010_11735 [Lacticaseibacillus manihotivorans]
MRLKWSILRPSTRKRSGVTLIETIVALGLLVGMFLMWQPVVSSLSQFTWRDAEELNVATFEQVTQQLVSSTDTVTVDEGRLVITKPATEKTIKNYSGKSGDLLIFTRANNEGYEPVLTDVAAVAWTEVDHAVKYTVTMKSGRIYEGVIVDGEKAR